MMFAEEVKEHVKRTRKLDKNIKFLWTVLWAQSSQAVRNWLEALNTYETMKQESNGLELLVTIKDLLYYVQDQKYVPLSIHLANRQFYVNSQGRSVSVASDRIPSTNPGAEPPRDARDSGSARSHSTHLETSSSDRP